MNLAVVACFLDEESFLPDFLESIAWQTVLPSRLLLVDDGSRDASARIAADFADRYPWASALSRPQRLEEGDRLVTAAELRAFQWGVSQLTAPAPDIVVKMDADLRLVDTLFEEVIAAFQADQSLGVTGSYLGVMTPEGLRVREKHPADHVRGPNKFYRWDCYQAISPLPTHLGWDTIDEFRARRAGWAARALEVRGGDSTHLRPTGAHGGALRAYRRWGECAWGYGAHPIYVLIGGGHRLARKPYLLAGANYVIGWLWAAIRRRPRVDRDLRRYVHWEERRSLSGRLRELVRR